MSINNDTIFALSSADVASAICVFRLSGDNVLQIAQLLTKKKHFEADKTYHASIYDPETSEKIDSGIVFFKQNPRSFTGQDSLEIQLHGSRAVIKKIYHILSKLDLCRPAEAGEFTKRAFLNNKIDIFQAEAIGDLVAAQTDYQRRMAQAGLSGHLSKFVIDLRETIIKLNAFTHAMIDFADDEVPPEVEKEIYQLVDRQIKALTDFIGNSTDVSDVKYGLKVAIIGAPNVGKSSFINNILQRDAVIVSDIAGTTRDSLEFMLDIKGYPVIFYDTAGLRETECPIEKKGIEITYQKIQDADLVLYLQDPNQESILEVEELLKRSNFLNIFTKKDIYKKNIKKNCESYFYISNVSRETLSPILDYIAAFFKFKYDHQKTQPLLNERYLQHINNALHYFKTSKINLNNQDFFLFSEDIRLVQYEIEKMTCYIDTEELLDKIFSSFCIGK